MTTPSMALPEGAEILEASGKGGTGNVLYRVPDGGELFVLKVYRYRRSRTREVMRTLSHLLIEGKRGAGPKARCQTERESLELWAREGFRVVKPLNRALPSGLVHPATWLPYRPSPILSDVIRDNTVELTRKTKLIKTLGRDMSARHHRAGERNEPLLIHEHGNINHFFVEDDHLIAFDLENGFRKGYPILEAIAQEIAGVARSIVRADPAHADDLLKAWIDGCTHRDLLREATRHAVHGKGPARKIKRWHDRRTRPGKAKTDVMERLLGLMGEQA